MGSLKLAPWSTPHPPCPAPQAPTLLTSNSGQLYWVQTEQQKEKTSEKQHQVKSKHSAKSVEANLYIRSHSLLLNQRQKIENHCKECCFKNTNEKDCHWRNKIFAAEKCKRKQQQYSSEHQLCVSLGICDKATNRIVCN